MPLSAGDHLGPYEIVAPLGKGGMGEVWKARDTRLGRDVAIKISAEQFSERFEREARAVAALNHPNICTLYDVGPNYLVMEYIEGRPLKGPLPLDQALKYAEQICEALDAAHQKGITHRDLKPGNILVTKTGVKLVDFGLAKLSAAATSSADGTTMTMAVTSEGQILGTMYYMSPEQLQGHEADARSDIFSFGLVLYEMLTGKRAFDGASQASVIAAILERPAPTVSTVAPPTLDHVLQSCLEKDRDNRWQNARDVMLELQWIARAPQEAVARAVRVGRKRYHWLATLALVLLVVGGIGWAWLGRTKAPSSPQSFAFTITPLPGTNFPSVGGQVGAPLLSPDGAFVLTGVALRNLNSFQVERLSGIQGLGGEPFWSPDSKWVAFPAGSQLRKMRVSDGASEALAPIDFPSRGGAWSTDGTILISAVRGGLYRLPPGGNVLELLVVRGLKEGSYYHPEFLPDGSDFLFLFREADSDEAAVYMATLRGKEAINPVQLLKNGTAAHYTPVGGGRLLLVRNDNLYVQRLNRKERKLLEDPELLQKGVATAPEYGLADFSVSHMGVVAWRPGTQDLSHVTIFDRQGKQMGTAGPAANFLYLRLSPDEEHLLAFSERGSYVLESNRPGALSLGYDSWSVWSGNGSKLFGPQGSRIIERLIGGPAETRLLANTPSIRFLEDVSPDGKVALYSAANRSVYSVPIDGSAGSKPIPIVDNGEQINNVRFSPDGHWIVYDARTAQGERLGIFVQPFGGSGLGKQISGGGVYPVWREDGQEIVYLEGQQVWSVKLSVTAGDLHFGSPQMLFPIRLAPSVTGLNPMAVSHDGSRFYFPQAVEQPDDSKVIQVRTGLLIHN